MRSIIAVDVIQELKEFHTKTLSVVFANWRELYYRAPHKNFSGDNLSALIYVCFQIILAVGQFHDIV